LALKEHSTEVDALHNKIIELESRIEGQEQYSRRTSLRFHYIKVPGVVMIAACFESVCACSVIVFLLFVDSFY
jgi:hypothetical protein